MKVLHLHASTTLGGTEFRAFQLASELRKQIDIAVQFHAPAGPICDYYREQGIPHWITPFPRILPVLRNIRTFHPDVIHIFGLKTNVLWRPLLYAFGYRNLIGHIAGLSNQGETPSRARLWIDRITLPFLKIYLSNSQKVADRLIAYGFDPHKLRVIHNGVVVPEALQSHTASDEPMIFSIGNLRGVKGHRYVLDALKLLKDRGVRFKACIVGEGPDRSSLQQLAASYGISNHLQFVGMLKNSALREQLRRADIFIIMSLSEGISGAAMEAMSFAIPVVATDVGGMAELISTGEDGFLIPVRTPAQAADRMAQLLSDPHLREQMGKKAYYKVREQFNLATSVLQYEKLYRDVL